MAQIDTVLGTSGDDTITTDKLSNFVVDALAGDDSIQVTDTAESFTVKGMDGDDTITISGDASAKTKLNGRAGADVIDLQGAFTSSSIYGGKGTTASNSIAT